MGHAASRILAAIVVGLMAVALSVSAATMIYQGPLSVFRDRGIALALIGGVLMGLATSRLVSWRGTICALQNPIAVVVALFSGAVAASLPDPTAERAFATVSTFVAATTLVTGLVAWLLGRLRLGVLARYIPFPVVSGFLAATGYLLVMGGLGAAIGQPVAIGSLAVLVEPGSPERWLPWTAAAVAIVLLTRRLRRPIVLPICLALALAGFHVALPALGLGLDDARDSGLLIGPFGGGFLDAFAGWRPLEVDGWGLAAGIPTLLTVVGIAIVATIMSASSIEVAEGVRIDLDRDLRAVGVGNIAAALGGGSVGYHSLALTSLASGMRMAGPMTGWIVAAASALALVAGAPVIGALPVGLIATAIIVVGLNLLAAPLVDQRRAMPAADYLVVLIIPVVTAASGFLWGVTVGLLASGLFFIVAFARVDEVRVATTGARMRSRIERSEQEQGRLAVLGRRAEIYGLEGYLFFGTADRFVQRVEAALARTPRPEHLLIDFRRVRGLDTSAARAIARLDETCRDQGVTLHFTGLGGTAERRIRSQLRGGGGRFSPRLEQALEEVEAALLAGDRGDATGEPGFLEDLGGRHPAADLGSYFRPVAVPAGAEVIAQGAPSDSLLVLRSGSLRIEVAVEDAAPFTVARCRPGAMVGEIGLYAGVPRTARVVSEEPSSFLRIDAEALDRMARDDPALLADFHRLIAAALARRLGRTTALLADAEVLAR